MRERRFHRKRDRETNEWLASLPSIEDKIAALKQPSLAPHGYMLEEEGWWLLNDVLNELLGRLEAAENR